MNAIRIFFILIGILIPISFYSSMKNEKNVKKLFGMDNSYSLIMNMSLFLIITGYVF